MFEMGGVGWIQVNASPEAGLTELGQLCSLTHIP